MSPVKKLLIAIVILGSLALLYPGVTLPVMTLTGTIEKSELAQIGINTLSGDDANGQARQMLTMISGLLGLDRIEGQLVAYDTTRSIWGTVVELAENGNPVVAFMVVFFSLVIPITKLLLLAVSLFLPQGSVQGWLLKISDAMSKWSMSDVFVMGLLVAYMAGSASGEMGDLLTMSATLEVGFYFFLAYCLFSITASVLVSKVLGSASTKVENTSDMQATAQ